jgi:hypothetical protein
MAEYFINVFYKLQVQNIYFIKEDGLTYVTGKYINFTLIIRVFITVL